MAWTASVVFLAATVVLPAAASAQPGPAQPDMPIEAKAKTEAIASLAQGVRAAYVFPEVGESVAKMLEERHARGEYDAVTSAKVFSQLVTRQMRETSHDKHLALAYSAGVLPPFPVATAGEPPPSLCPECELRMARATNFGFERVERLGGNVGYLKFDSFEDHAGGDRVAAGAMAFVANTDALIIDLRDNHGGGLDMFALLASYFFERPVHLLDLAFRVAGTTDYKVTQTWTLPYVPGQRFLDKEVYILTSSRTFSIAEAFADALQTHKRATLVGATTAGGANGGAPYRVADHFFAAMPNLHFDNPTTRTNWEGKGVAPDIAASDQDAVSTAYRRALQRLVEKTTDAQALAGVKQALAALEKNLKP